MTRARARQFMRFAGSAFALLLLGAGLFNFVVDPLQFFRAATLNEPHFSDSQRYQNPGLARNYPYDTVVLGTSHMENFTPSRVAAALGGAPLKLTVGGGSAREQYLMLQLATRNPQLKRVIWGVLADSFDYSDEVVSDYGPFPWHFYRRDAGVLTQYLWSFDTLAQSLSALSTPPHVTLESLNTWYDRYPFGADRVEAAWAQMGLRWTDSLYDFYAQRVPPWEDTRYVAQRRIVQPIKAQPQLRFDIVFPAYTLLEYANDFRVHRERFARRLLFKAYLMEQLAASPNVHFYDFETDLALSTDLSRFKDLAHFNIAMTEQMLRDIAANNRAPVARPDQLLARQLVSFIAARCASHDEMLCPARVRCGGQGLSAWLAAGGAQADLLRFSNLTCK